MVLLHPGLCHCVGGVVECHCYVVHSLWTSGWLPVVSLLSLQRMLLVAGYLTWSFVLTLDFKFGLRVCPGTVARMSY